MRPRLAAVLQVSVEELSDLLVVTAEDEPPSTDRTRYAMRYRDRRKSRAIVLGNLTLSRIREGKLDAALASFTEAVEELHGTRGGGGLNIAFRAARELRPWRNKSAVQEAQDRLMALMEAA